MEKYLIGAGFALMVLGLWMPGSTSEAAIATTTATSGIPAVYTNENFWSSPHDRPVTFKRDVAGNFYGTTATGKQFSQIVVENTLSIRLMKFSIDEAFFYVSDRGIIVASSDTAALSIYVATETVLY